MGLGFLLMIFFPLSRFVYDILIVADNQLLSIIGTSSSVSCPCQYLKIPAEINL